MELQLKSLTDLFDDGIADLGLIDNCELGVDFLNIGKKIIDLTRENARMHNIHTEKLREAINYSRRSLEFLQQYTQVGVTAEILSELEKKIKLASDHVRIKLDFDYAKKFGHASQHRLRLEVRSTHHIKKEVNLLENITENERRIHEMLQQRVWSRNDEEAQAYRSLVIGAWICLGRYTQKNRNDEKMVAAALALAVKQDKYVAIITADNRIGDILIKTQRALQTMNIPYMLRATNQPATTISFERLRQRLEEGKVMVVTALPTKVRYEVEYNSADFYQRKVAPAPVPVQIPV
ncbi:MAG: hypothetical protein Q8L34_04185 [Candidatus Woesearchaeota archaeon]|nr:hypothetical protein [Candidatus Woesearchaeota archaeon]